MTPNSRKGLFATFSAVLLIAGGSASGFDHSGISQSLNQPGTVSSDQASNASNVDQGKIAKRRHKRRHRNGSLSGSGTGANTNPRPGQEPGTVGQYPTDGISGGTAGSNPEKN